MLIVIKKKKKFQEIAFEYCNNRTWGNQLYMKDHLRDLSYSVFLALNEKQNIDMEQAECL